MLAPASIYYQQMMDRPQAGDGSSFYCTCVPAELEMMKLNVQLAEATDAAAAAKAAAENAAANANHANAALAALQAAASLGSNVVSATGLSRGATADQAVASLAEAVTVGTGGSSTGSGGAGAGSSSNMGSRAIGGAGADRQVSTSHLA